jgi:ABC-2 type transport system ATP-binding protein
LNGVEIQSLTKSYGSLKAVSDLSLAVNGGEIFALLGPNGAGKTTTIRMMIGMLQPSAGSVRICGLDCFTDRAQVMRHVGYLPDDPVFYDYLRGREILRFVGEMHGMSRADIDRTTAPLIERMKLDEALEDYAVNYSKGMKKKLALIAALVHDPDVLILDEPTNGLDPFATRALHELLLERAAAHKLVFYSTHILEQAERLCKRVGILFNGQLAALGEIEELRTKLTAGGSLEDVFFAVASERTA